jgi:hypothetical protein
VKKSGTNLEKNSLPQAVCGKKLMGSPRKRKDREVVRNLATVARLINCKVDNGGLIPFSPSKLLFK